MSEAINNISDTPIEQIEQTDNPTRMTVGEIYMVARPHITFLKNNYDRHTDFYTKNVIYNFIDNKAIAPKNINQVNDEITMINVITKVWINNISNIKSFGVYIVGSDVDLSNFNFNNDDLIKQNDSILQLHKVNNITILTYDLIIKRNEYLSDWIHVPCGNLCMIPSILDHQQIIFVIEKHNDAIENSLQIKYKTVGSEYERSLFLRNFHEYLLKKYKSFSHNLTRGQNIINFDITNESITHMFITIPKNKNSSNTKIQIQYNTFTDIPENLNQTFEESRKIVLRIVDLIKTTDNPELAWLMSDEYDIYMLDACANTTRYVDNQTCGIISIKNNSKIIIDIESATDISINYSYLDVLRYSNGCVDLSRRILRVVNTEGINSINQINEVASSIDLFPILPLNPPQINTYINNDEETNNEETDEIENNPIINTPIGSNMDNDVHNRENNTDDDVNDILIEINMIAKSHYLLSKMLISYAKYSARSKLLPKTKNICQICWEEIKYGDYYYECYVCKNVFNMNSLSRWINKTNFSSSCPTCREPIYEQPELYKNGYFWNKWTDNLCELVNYGKNYISTIYNHANYTKYTKHIGINITMSLLSPNIKIPQC